MTDPYDLSNYNRYNLKEYSPDLMFRQLIRFIDANKSKPFFMYWATPIPHVPLQAPKEWIDHYVKKFGDEKPYTGDRGYFPQRYPHAAYAAMVSYLDWHIGQLVAHLKKLNIYDNTLIIFTSDNGPTYNGGSDSPWFSSGGPFKSEYGWGKGFVHEAGIRVPFIASWTGHIEPGTQSDLISAFWDVLPTLCEVTGALKPGDTDGISLLPTLEGRSQKKHQYLYWEFPEYGGQQAVRMGDWKGIRENMRTDGDTAIQLFDLSRDIQELNNVAAEYPDVVLKMKELMRAAHIKSFNEDWQFQVLHD
jgi:arylsulfatase